MQIFKHYSLLLKIIVLTKVFKGTAPHQTAKRKNWKNVQRGIHFQPTVQL